MSGLPRDAAGGCSPGAGETKLACPRCLASLALRGAEARCASGCGGGPWPVVEGIVRFVSHSPYWGEVEEAQMGQALRDAREHGWRAALGGALRELREYVDDAGRADWRYELARTQGLQILDLGSGLGQISYLLARAGHRVWSCEAVGARVEFQRLRRDQEGLDDRLTLAQANLFEIPFSPESFDVVILNGVLEWVGIGRRDGDPRDLQIGVLREIRRRLRPDGLLYIGIENRIGYTTFLGALDHSGLRFTSLLPRRAASVAVRFLRPRYRTSLGASSYRTYTYSPCGYRRLLAEAGFAGVRVQWVLPGYNEPRVAIELSRSREARFLLRELLMQGGRGRRALLGTLAFLCRFGFMAAFAPHLSIWAERGVDG